MPRMTALVIGLGLAASACAAAPGDRIDATPTETLLPTTEPPASKTSAPEQPSNGSAPEPSSGTVELPGSLAAATGQWNTDWSRSTIDLSELLVGIAAADPRDRIAPIDDPKFEGVDDARLWLVDREPGLLYEFDGSARFYPLSILTLHEIVNDVAGGVPVAVTYCPLCNTAIVFDRRIDGTTVRLGVSGLLRNSDLVMWDDVTESLFQQITGEGIVGAYAGTDLTPLPSVLVGFGDFAAGFPDGEVLSRDTGFGFPYGLNPYEGYSSRDRPFRFFEGEIDPRYPALERVVGVTVGDTSKAYPFPEIAARGAVNDTLAGVPIVVLWSATDTADALDTGSIADARSVGAGVAYSRQVDGRLLTFEAVGGSTFRDLETGTSWSILGAAIDGPLAGSSLTTVVHRNEFWFAWAAFFPESDVFTG